MSPGKRVVVLVLLVVSCLIAYTSRPILASATAGINSQISFTGKLVKSDNTNITDGTYNMEFKVYQDGTNTGVGSTLMWTEDYLVAGSTGMPSTGGVTFSSGTFSVNLGSICAFAGGTCGAKTNTGVDFNQNTLWVSVQIGNSTSCTVTSSTTSFNTACGGDGEMSPYIRLTAVPYAANAALLSGVAVTALGQLASNQTWTGNNTFQPSSATALSIVQGNAAGNLTLTNTAATSSSLLSVSQSTSAYTGTALLINLAVGSGTFASGNFIDFQTNNVSKYKVDSTGAVTANSFSGSGASLTSLSGTNISSGTVPDARLSTNVALLNGTGPQTFTGNNKFTGTVLDQNAADSTAAFQVQNVGNKAVLTADTSNGQLILGNSSAGGVNGTLEFLNTTNTSYVQLVSGVTTASYSLTLPLTAPTAGQCLTASSTTQLAFASCATGGSGVTTVGTFSGSSQTNGANITGSTITFGPADATNPGMVTTGTQSFAGAKTFTNTVSIVSGSASAFLIQDASSNAALAFDASSSILKVYENVTSPTNYASISYASGAAIFAASTGNTQIGTGSGTGGNINLSLNVAADQLLASKTVTLAAAYNITDYKFTRNITAGAYAATGNILTVEDLSTIGAGSSAPNVLYVNQNNTSATGNLILARTGGGSNDKFKVDTNGTVTIATGQSYTSVGTLTLDSASASALSIGTGANAHNTTIGNTTGSTAILIQAGTGNLQLTTQGTGTLGIGNNAVAQTLVIGNATGATSATLQAGTGGLVLKPITSNTTAFTLQDSASNKFLILDTTNSRLQVGNTTADGTGVLLVLDTKNTTGDPTGVVGGMYYNSYTSRFRCYEGTAWADCLGFRQKVVLASDVASTASTACQTLTGLSFPVIAGVTYNFHANIAHTASATTIGAGFGFSGPASPTLFAFTATKASGTTASTTSNTVAYSTCTVSTSSAYTTGNIDTVDGVIIPSANGTVQMLFSPETATANGTVIKAGSSLEWW